MARISKCQNPVAIQSVTCSVNYGVQLNLHSMARITINTEYKLGGRVLVKRFRGPSGLAMIFKSGRVTFLGHKTEYDAWHNAKRLNKMLRVCGYHSAIEDFKVTQIVGTASFNGGIDFHKLKGVEEYRELVYCEPEQDNFGLVTLSNGIKAKATVNGYVTFLGAKKVSELTEAWRELFVMLLRHKDVSQ